MLNITTLKGLSKITGFAAEEIAERISACESDVVVYELNDYSRGKVREVISVRGITRKIQERLNSRLFVPRLDRSDASHGGVPLRSVRTNIRCHSKNSYFLKCDIKNFFPSINYSRVCRFFITQGCSPKVARVLARFCTYDRTLALGLVNSPIIADAMMLPLDLRIISFCRKYGLTYSRYVDDIFISARYSFLKTKIEGFLVDLFDAFGFQLSSKYGEDEGVEKKFWFGDRGSVEITGIRILDNHLDVTQKYLSEFLDTLGRHESLSSNGDFSGHLFHKRNMIGRVNYIGWINPRRKKALKERVDKINWLQVAAHAEERGLLVTRRELRRLNRS